MPDEDLSSNAWEESALQALYYAFGESDEEGQKLFLNMVFESYYARPSFLSKILHQIREIREEDLFEVSEETLAWVSFWERYDYNDQKKIPNQIKKLKKLAGKEILEALNRGTLFFHLGHMEGELKHDEEACRYYQHAAELHPSFSWTYNNWGNRLGDLGRYEEAIEKYQQAIERDPNNASAYYNWGNRLENIGRHEEAIEKYQQAIERNPNNANAYYNWGNSLANLGRHEEAIEKYQQAIERDPNHARSYYNWGKNLANLGRHEEAIEKYQQAFKLNSDNVHAKEHLKRK